MTDTKSKILDNLTETSRRTTKVQHEGLDALLGEINIYRTSVRNQPDNGCARVDTLKNMQSLLGMLACADGRQTIVRETRAAINVQGILDPTFDELVDQDNADKREGLVNDVLAAADDLVDQGLVFSDPALNRVITELEVSVHELFSFDEELDESDDDDDTDEEPTEPGIVILPPALTMGEQRELNEFFRSLGFKV